MRRWLVWLAAGAIIVMSGCQLLPLLLPKATPSAAIEMMPDLEGYTVVEGETLLDYVSNMGGGAALLLGHPELAAALVVVDGVVSCYEEIGAVQARIYSNEEEPLSAGAVAIADRNALEDPRNLLRCVGPGILPEDESGIQTVLIQPCTASYTLTKDDNEFTIVYAGTTLEICQTFCAALEGCTAHLR